MDINSKAENKTKKKPQDKMKLKRIFFKVAEPPPLQKKKAKHAVLTKEHNTSP